MSTKFVSTLLCLSALLPVCAEENDAVPLSAATQEEGTVLRKLNGVVLIFNPPVASTFKPASFPHGFSSVGAGEIPGGAEEINQKLGSRFLGKPLGKAELAMLKQELATYFRERGYPMVAVKVPEQHVADGVLQIAVVQGVLDQVTVRGNRWFSSNLIRSYIDVKEGEPLSLDELMNGVAWINRNPFRYADVVLESGHKANSTNVELVVKDRLPLKFYLGGDNTGNSATGEARFFTGITWGNFAFCDHSLTYQFATSEDFHKFRGNTIYYSAPLPWRNTLVLFGGWSTVHPDITDFSSKGESSQASLRYAIPLGRIYKPFLQEITWGFDYKSTNNNLTFEDNIPQQPIVNQMANLTQLYLSYDFSWNTSSNKLDFDLEGFWSPGKWISHQTNAAYNNINPGAVNHYIYGRATLEDTWRFWKGFSLYGLLRGQVSSEKLLPSEEVGLGGYNSVRGYPEREVNVDNSFIANAEFHLPPFPLFWFSRVHRDSLILLGFFDYAMGKNVADGANFQQLMSVGPGFRYNINPYFSLRFDWGFRLKKAEFSGEKGNKIHLGIMANY